MSSQQRGRSVALAVGLTVATSSGSLLAQPADDAVGPLRHSESVALGELEELREESLAMRRALSTSVLVSGVSSIVVGGVMTIPDDYDAGIRWAGMSTIAFGAVNTVVGAVALYGIEAEAEYGVGRSYTFVELRDHALADEAREAWAHGINLGLAAAYGGVGGAAIAASQLGVDHPNRWLGSGIAISAQALHLLAVDLIGTLSARDIEREMRSIRPQVSLDDRGGSQLGLAYGGYW